MTWRRTLCPRVELGRELGGLCDVFDDGFGHLRLGGGNYSSVMASW